MKLIKYEDFSDLDLTVDNANITVDSGDITVDATIISGNTDPIYAYMILAPRILPELSDTLTLYIRNELTNVEKNLIVDFSYENSYLKIKIPKDEIDINSKYQITLTDSINNILYKGKAYTTDKESVQDFKNTVITSKKLYI